MPKDYTFKWPSLKKMIVKNYGGQSDMLANMNSILKGTAAQKGPHTFWGYRNLTSLTVKSCDGLRQLFTSSVAISFGELQHLEVEWCKSLEAIVAAEGREEEEDCTTEQIICPKLNHLVLYELPNLSTIMPKGYTFKWPSLKKMIVKNCGEWSHIFANVNIIQMGTTGQKMLLTSLEDMEIEGLNSTELWRNHFPGGWPYELRYMALSSCNTLSVIFSSHLIRGCHNLEKLELRNCNSLEVVFDLEELIVGGEHKLIILNRLNNMGLYNLARMTHVWKKVPKIFEGFQHLTWLKVEGCNSLRYLFPPLIAKCLVNLRTVLIEKCEMMEEVVSRRDEGENQENAIDMIFFPKLEQLNLVKLQSLISLSPGAYAFQKPSLGTPNDASSETHHEGNANTLISSPIFNGKTSNPSSASVTLEGIGRCQLPAWSFHNLIIVYVHECHKLLYVFPPNIVVRLSVLQRLSIEKCDSLKYLLCSSTVTSLEQLSVLEISECEMMEVIVKDEEEADITSKLVLPSLGSITLKSLPNLRGFCLGVLGFEWPSLTSVEIKFCWKMGIFTSGYPNTTLLDDVLINFNQHSLDGDLNTTLLSVQQQDLDNLALKEGILTMNGFLVAGEHLVAQCPSWSWQSADSKYGLENFFLPAKRRFLITRNVPCLRRASSKVVENKNEADECADGKIPRPRTYDVSITYDINYEIPLLWLKGYDESKMPLPLELVLEDIVEFHPRELVTIKDHPHLDEAYVSLYGGLLPSFKKDFSDYLTLQGLEPNVHHYMQLLLDFHVPRLPTIQYCFR